MRIKICLLLTASWLCLAASFAHSHHSFMSFFNVNQGLDMQWRLSAVLARSSVTEEFARQNLDLSDSEDATAILEQKLADYLINTISMKMDGHTTKLRLESINLGSHETRAVFTLEGIPNKFKILEASIQSFADGRNHHNILTLIVDAKKNRQILSHKNDFTAEFELNQSLASRSP
ncbi:hypothetical protein [Hahella ganghwensis]|uniref:hypothetical protein n=1 Tax=Hahella ganghwensis TaxID=286420 RepID=UPI00035E4746|nr:hypothetical protein [Hahella ganghwensis]